MKPCLLFMKPWVLLLAMPLLWLSPARAQNDGAPIPGYPPLEQFEEIMARPLFDDNRRPQEDEEEESISESAAEMREKWRLSGVVWENDQQLALFSERQGAGRARIKIGMYLDGNWQLEDIDLDAVTLSDGSQSLRLELWEPRQPSPRPAADTDTDTDTVESPADNTGAQNKNPNEANAEPDTDSAEATRADDNNKQGSNGESQ
ncbi:hypothetical protein [Oceanisphaera arctica]|uniref:Type II secretion system protein GspC N-terminal domain-containing protein n=1 Tax=Oceanisphaera arctica TaxID=641510 RepID=A0A2P5TPF7_9GAMM|nr:hypothetical protein [Oceanisphaera arctica]PPL17528.1 hypothetical protein UN63_04360 [Oceanisphaera arctica]GHA16519.1 hypothetical protein GCM10007082_16620 [Oceanisphaera arctica]